MTREKNQITIDDSENCCLSQSKDGQTLFLAWKSVPGLLVQDFAEGVSKLAMQCGIRQPKYAVIDAQKLDPTSPAVAWLRGEGTDANGDNYQTWWMRDIVSAYNDAGIVSLAVATGDPSAPGELQETPPGVNFKIAYFPELSAATTWRPEAMRQLEPSTNAPANLKGLRGCCRNRCAGLDWRYRCQRGYLPFGDANHRITRRAGCVDKQCILSRPYTATPVGQHRVRASGGCPRREPARPISIYQCGVWGFSLISP